MARKKLSKVLAWTLAAAMAVSPVNLTWASESADLFSDNSENTESVEMSADETDSLQQNEQDTQAIVSANEEDTFTAEDAVDVFSAGDASGEGEESEGEKQILTDVGTLTVKAYEEFIFAPERNATYRISTDNKEDGIEIMVSSTHGLGTCNYYTMKTGPGHSYPIYIESESEGDITVKVEEVSPIRSISVDDTWKGNFTYPLEQVIADEINPYLPVTVTLEDGKQVSGEYGSYVDGYGKVSVVYEDTDGKLMWDKESGNLNCPRPTTPGTYKYHFFCIADPDITSKAYTVELKSFDELFGKNIVTKEGEAFKVALDKNTYIRRLDRNYLLYHYGFKITPDVDATYYVEINDGLCISVMDEFGGWHREEMWESGSFDMKAGKTYYFTLITEEQLDDQTTVLTIDPVKIQYPSPTGSISIENNTWDSDWPVKNITFTSERAYKNSVAVTVNVQPGSDECGIDKVYYFLASSGKKMSQEELNNLSDSKWTELTDGTFTLNPGSKYVAYVKITDKSGNVTYVLSDGIIVDDTAPKITGITNEKKYCSGISFAVADDVQVKAVTVDGNSVEPDEKGNYIISKSDVEADHIIVAEDMAGNAVTYKVTVGTKEGHSYLTDPSTDENGWKVIAPATCEKAGNKSRTCKNEGCGFTETESIPALGHDIDFSKNPQFVWEVVPGESLGTIEHYGDVPKYKAKAVFYCSRCEDYTVEKKCSVFNTTAMGTNGSLSLVYTASVEVEGKEFTETKTIWLNKPDEKNNRVLVETNIESNAPKTIIAGVDNNLVENILTKEEADIYNNVNSSTDVLISPKVNAISEEKVTSKEKIDAELNKIISNMSETPKLSKIEYYDVSLLMSINSAAPREIKDTKRDITVGLELSKEARNVPTGFDRKFYVIRDHGGNITRLDATRNGDYLNFDTSLFSTYAVAYIDVKASTSSPSYPGTPSYPVTDVTLSQDKADLTKVGETLQLTATVKPSYADNKTITWKSSDEKVATVDKDGKVTAVANGTATITATSADGKHSATAAITVKIAPEKLTLTAENKTLTKVGETLQITAKIEPDNAYDKLIWKSSDERVATVDVDGKVTAAGNGKAIITATTEDGKLSESVTITVKIPEKPAVNAITGYGNLKARSVTQTNNSIKVEWSRLSGADGYIVYGSQCNGNGKAYKYKKLATITNGKTRTWTHTKLKKATYYKYIVKAYKLVDGKKVITDTSVSVHAVTKGGNYGVAKAVSVTKIGNKKNVTEVILKKGKTAQITAAELKKDKKIKHHRKLCYESSNPNVATVTAKGMIKAIGKGSCTVWVYAQNGVYKAITVTVK